MYLPPVTPTAVGAPIRRSLTCTEQGRAIELFNRGYGYDYVARFFHCDRGFLKGLKYRLKKLGFKVKDLSRNGGIKGTREHYVKLFSYRENVDRAIKMLQDGKIYQEIADELGCDRTSVLDFHDRMAKRGILPKCVDGKRLGVHVPVPRPPKPRILPKPSSFVAPPKPVIIVEVGDERRNQGRTYKEYVTGYLRKRKEQERQRMAEARVRLAEIKKQKIALQLI